MRPDVIVLAKPYIDCSLGLMDSVEPIRIEDIISDCAVKAFIVTIFPRRAWIDLLWPNIHFSEPSLKMFSNELRAIVGANELWLSAL